MIRKGANEMSTKARKWDEIYKNLESLTEEDRGEIALKVKIVGEVLKARQGEGITQAELASITGVKQSFIARLEKNRMDPQLTTVLRILKPLGKTLAVVPIERAKHTNQ
jgi:DNA-binding XRE family transcriptional regulator